MGADWSHSSGVNWWNEWDFETSKFGFIGGLWEEGRWLCRGWWLQSTTSWNIKGFKKDSCYFQGPRVLVKLNRQSATWTISNHLQRLLSWVQALVDYAAAFLCRPHCPLIQRSVCLCFPSARIEGMCHHCLSLICLFTRSQPPTLSRSQGGSWILLKGFSFSFSRQDLPV